MFLTSPVCQSNQLHEQWFKMASRKRKLSSTSQWHRKTFAKLLSSHEKLLCYFVAIQFRQSGMSVIFIGLRKLHRMFFKKRQILNTFQWLLAILITLFVWCCDSCVARYWSKRESVSSMPVQCTVNESWDSWSAWYGRPFNLELVSKETNFNSTLS